MSWTPVLTRWPQHLDQLCQRFPHLELSTLKRVRNDPMRLAAHLAQTHDLTVAEASEALEDWMTFRAAHQPETAAA